MPRWQQLSAPLAVALLMVAAMASEMSAPHAQHGKTVAGAFQNYSDEGHYKWHGENSLDHLCKSKEASTLAIQAESWSERETLVWPIWLAAEVETLGVVFANNFYDADTGEDGRVSLDRLRVIGDDGQVIVYHEFEELGPPIAPWGPCVEVRQNPATGLKDHLVMWNGHINCAFYIDSEIPGSGVYDVEIVARAPRYQQYGEGGFARLSVVADNYGYHDGDTWYRDMRTPGFGGDAAPDPDPDNSVQWLARQIVADDRFAEATVRFWWPAIMGSEVAEFPEESSDTDFEGRLLAANAQDAEVVRLANGFRRGFHGGAAYNLKDLLTEIVLAEWFRADALTDSDPVRRTALRDAGARRLLTPEELARKTAAVTGVQWGRRSDGTILPYTGPWRGALTDEYRMLYGGIDSEGVTERARDLTSVMAGVARRHAVQVACPAVLREFYMLSDAERRLFGGIKSTERGADAVKAKLVELHDRLLGVRVTVDSADVEAAYQLFVDVSARGKRAGRERYEWWRCDHGHDHMFLDGILDNPLVREDGNRGWWWHEFDWDRVHDFFDGLDLSDPHHTAQAWAMVLTAMMMDYRYLYL